MPEIVTKYKVFLASPSDLKDDRQSIDEVVKELNLTYGSQNNLVIEIVKWETHAAPGVSKGSVQGIISKDIGSNYDLFIGLMWLKFGTPTDIAGSGTEEEFMDAYQRFQNESESLQILFYFKTSLPQSLNDINPDELRKVNLFKEKIGNEHVLYWNYNSIEELQSFLRLHIPKRINKLKESVKTELVKFEPIEAIKTVILDDLGLLDYVEIYENRFKESTIAVSNINTATELIGQKINEKADEINRLSKIGNHVNNNHLRRLLSLSAQAMNEYAARLSVETPIFFENYEEGIKTLSSIVNISDDFYDKDNIEELIDSKESIIVMNAGISAALTGMTGFYESVISLPRIEKEINRAKRNVAEKLEILINDLSVSSQLAIELIREISEKIDRIEIARRKK